MRRCASAAFSSGNVLSITGFTRPSRNNGITYSQLIHGLKMGAIDIDRKMLAERAVHDAEGFAAVVASAKQHLAAAPAAPQQPVA